MKNHFLFWVFIFVLSSCNCLSFKNNKACTACSIEIVKETDINLRNLTKKQIEYFLCTIKSECINNVEFQEYSNNILFKVIEAYPSDFVKVFSTSKIIDKNILLLQISNPIKDYNTPVLIQKIELSKGDNYSIAQIVKALKEIK